MNSEVQFYFPSIVLKTKLENFSEIKDDLIEEIYKIRQEDDGIQNSNRGGWHSHNILYEECFNKYVKIITRHSSELLFQVIKKETKLKYSCMWININKRGDHNRSHCHPQCDFSAVLWIKGQGSQYGNLEFQSPHIFDQSKLLHSLNPDIKDRFSMYPGMWLVPEEGQMVIFPSNLNHLVYENTVDCDRISIAFNINLQ